MSRLALFDLDHTLLPFDSDYEWGQFLVRQGVVDGELHSSPYLKIVESNFNNGMMLLCTKKLMANYIPMRWLWSKNIKPLATFVV